MTFRALLLSALMLTACGDPGPTPEEVAARDLDRACGMLYSSLTKVYRDELYKGGVAEVEFAEKAVFVKDCAASGLNEDQRKCMDPNRAGEECKKTLEPVQDKAKALVETLLAPMKAEEEPAEGAPAEEAAGE